MRRGRPREEEARRDLGALDAVDGSVDLVLLGLAIAKGVAVYAGWKTIVTLWSIVLSVGVSAAVGLVFGSDPAMRAARLDPVEALRYE